MTTSASKTPAAPVTLSTILQDSISKLDAKRRMFAARHEAAKMEVWSNDEVFASNKLVFEGEGNEAALNMLSEGHAAVGRALKLKVAKLEVSLADVSAERSVVTEQLAKTEL